MSGIDKVHWNVLSPLLDELLELDETARDERLARISSGDGNLARELSELLQKHRTIEEIGFLEGSALQRTSEPSLAGQVVGNYTLDRPLGQGGMGMVWLAHRSDGRYEAHVAIKLLNLALVGPSGIDRFEREGSLLARLTHPNIARLLDAGVTAAGQPYLVLEYIEGEPIDRWCNEHALDVTARVQLFLEVLAAVSHAHSHLILHRDLKPLNILVNAQGSVKLLDFGLAKLLADQYQSAPISQLTQLTVRGFTPEYASPEQVQGLEVTTATDVYALGILLYVLLTGEHPTARHGQTTIERLRGIVDIVPPRPSEVVLRSAKSGSDEFATTARQRARALQGDLNNIIAKALKKAPAERYLSVEALGEDLKRYLNHEPVSARADSFSYRAARFVARNKLAVGAGALVLMAIVTATAVSLWQAREATRQRDRALVLLARNEAVADFVTYLLMDAAPADRPVRMADLLDRSQSIVMAEKTEPEHQAAILGMLSEYFLSSGNPVRAQVLLDRSLELTRTSTDDALRGSLLCYNALAYLLQGRLSDAQAAVDKGLELSAPDPLAAVKCLRIRAQFAQTSSDSKGALDFALRAQARLRESAIAKPDQEAGLLADIASAHYLSGRTREADRYYAASIAKLTEIGRGDGASAAAIRMNWGNATGTTGDIRAALHQYDEAMRLMVDGPSSAAEAPPYLLGNRAAMLAVLGRYPEALAGFDLAIAAAERSGHARSRIYSLANKAGIYLTMGDVTRAERELAPLIAEVGKTIRPDSVAANTIKQVQARIALARNRLPEALAGFSSLVDFFDERKISITPLTRALTYRGEVYLQQGNLAAALADAERALQISRTLQADKPHSVYTGLTLALVARVHKSRGEISEARAAAVEAERHLSATLGKDHPETQAVMAYRDP
jgi:eukaryotic-like serine/threonine-protein kinase